MPAAAAAAAAAPLLPLRAADAAAAALLPARPNNAKRLVHDALVPFILLSDILISGNAIAAAWHCTDVM